MAYRNPNSLPGVKTWVNEDNTKNIPPDAHRTNRPNSSGGDPSNPSSKPDQRTQALPRTRTPDSEIRRPAQPVYNAPGGSGSHPAGNLHEDRVRTKGKPGDQYRPQPIDQPRGQFRRRTMTSEEHAASNMGKRPSGQSRQKEQKSTAYKEKHLWYLKNRKQVIRRALLRYKRIRKSGLFKRDRKMRRQNPQWFARKKGGGYTNAKHRAKDYRKGITRTKTKHKRAQQDSLSTSFFVLFHGIPVYMQGEGFCDLRGVSDTGTVVYRYRGVFRKISLRDFFLRCVFQHAFDLHMVIDTLDSLYLDPDEVESMDKTAYSAQRKNWGRRKRTRGLKRVKRKKYRLANRAKIKQKQTLYRRKLKRNPKYKRIQKMRRRMQKANPRRFRVRTAEVLTSDEIAFVTGADLKLGFVRSVSTMTGWVTYRLENGRVASIPLPAFWNSVVLFSEADVDAMFDLIDVEVGHEAFSLEMDYDQMRMCVELLGYDDSAEEFTELCMTETGVASINAMTADQLNSVASAVMHKVLIGGGRQITNQPEGDVFPRDEADRDPRAHGKSPLYFGQVRFPEEAASPMPNGLAARVASRCADIGVYDKADLVRRETNPKEKSPTSLPDGSDEEAAYSGLPTWVGPNKLREERENQKPAQGMSVKRDMPGAPGSAKVIPRGQGFVGRTASPTPAQASFIKALFNKLVGKGWIDSSKVLTDEQIEALDPLAVGRLIRGLKAVRSNNSEWEIAVSYGDGSRPKWRRKSNRQIVAAKMAEIMDGCAGEIHERASVLSTKLRRVDPRNAVWLFDVSGGEKTHRVRLKAVRRGNLRNLSKADVLVSCDCNFWRWQGPEHWAKVGGYLYGRPNGTATKPSIKDPEGQHRACKHVLSVLGRMSQKDVYFRAKKPSKPRRRLKGSASADAGRVARKYLSGD